MDNLVNVRSTSVMDNNFVETKILAGFLRRLSEIRKGVSNLGLLTTLIWLSIRVGRFLRLPSPRVDRNSAGLQYSGRRILYNLHNLHKLFIFSAQLAVHVLLVLSQTYTIYLS